MKDYNNANKAAFISVLMHVVNVAFILNSKSSKLTKSLIELDQEKIHLIHKSPKLASLKRTILKDK